MQNFYFKLIKVKNKLIINKQGKRKLILTLYFKTAGDTSFGKHSQG